MPKRWFFLVGILIPFLAFAATTPVDPDSPAEEKRAQDALKNAKVLPIQSKVLNITGVSMGIDAALKDLNAKVTKQEITIGLDADVLFDFNKADLRAEANATLEKVVVVLRGYPNGPVYIEGHTDSVGTDAYNLKLSEQRAASVKNWFVKNGSIPASRISTVGLGETKPVAPNTNPDGSDNPEGRQKNRRVEIRIKTNAK
jgi:outer membrane protein OmpA-like peptidoglycan-associated protein